MEFKLVTEKDKSRIKWLWGYCFEREEPFYSWYFTDYYKNENTLACYDKGQMLAAVQLIPYELMLRGKYFPVSYLVGLATFPEARNQRVVKKLLQSALLEMRSRGHDLSILMPFKAGFYYPYQWYICYYRYRYKVRLRDFKRLGSIEGTFHFINDFTELDTLNYIYERFLDGKNGYIKRSCANWRSIMECHWGYGGFIYLLKREQRPVGYIFYLLHEGEFLVRELAYVDFAAQKSLYQFMYKHRTQVERINWQSASDDLTYCLLPEINSGVELVGFMSGRIVDLEKLLVSLSYPADYAAELILQVEDNLAEWNNDLFKLSLNEGRMAVTRISAVTPEVSCQIGPLSQLVFGALSVRQLVYLGKITVLASDKLAVLEKLFPVCSNFINEYF